MTALGSMTNPVHIPGCTQQKRDPVCRGHRYFCPECKRWCGWCFGAADAFPELCDDCAVPKLNALDAEYLADLSAPAESEVGK